MTYQSIEWNISHSCTHETAPLFNWASDHDNDVSFHVFSCQSPASSGHFQDESSFNSYEQGGTQVLINVPQSSTPVYTYMSQNTIPAHQQDQKGQQDQRHQQGISLVTTPPAMPRSKRHRDEPSHSSMVVWATSPPPPPLPSPRPFMFTNDDKYIITREGHVPVSVYLTQLHRIGARFVHNPQGASFQLGVRGLPGVFYFHPVFLTLQSLAFRQLYDGWDGRCGMFEVTVPFPESFPGVWEFLFTGDVARFLRVCFSDSDTLSRTWAVMQCLRVQHLPDEIIFRARLEFEAVRLRPPG